MPVDYKPVPGVRPTERPTPEMSITFPHVNFTGAIGSALGELGKGREVLGGATREVGAALASLGGSFDKAGDEIFNRAAAIKHVENQTAAVEADTKWMMTAGQATADFHSKTGNAASQGLEAFGKGLENQRQQIRNTLPNDDARHAFDEKSLYTLGRTVFNASIHANGQSKAAAIGAWEANFKMEESTLANQFTTGKISEEEFNQKRQQMRENYTANSAKLLGEKGPQLEFALKQRDSKLTSAWLTGMGKTDPTSALNKLDEFVAKDQIMAADAMKLRSDLEGSQVMVSTRVESDRAINTVRKSMQDDPNAAVPTMDEVRAKAFDSLPDNIKNDPVRGPLALEITSRRVASDYMDLMKGKVQAQQNTVQYLSGLLHPKDGPPITKEEQMYAAKPDAEAMYNSLPNEGPWSKKTVRGIMLDNLRGANRHDPLESGQMVSDFKGQADRGGESAMALLGVNPWDPKLPLNVNDRRRLEGIRNSIKDNPAGNNEVQKVFNTLKQNFRQEMTDLHIIGRTIHDDTVNRTYGAIGAAYEDFVTTHKGLKPTEKDIVEMGKEILRHSAGSMLPGWLGGTPAEPAMVEREPPADWVKGYVDKKTQEDGVAPTSDQIYHDYQLGLWDLIHQGRTRTSPVPQARPEPVAGPAQGTQGLPTVPTSR